MFQSAPAPVGAGDLSPGSDWIWSLKFQSAPAPVGAGDTWASQASQRCRCFNPRPLP